MISRRVRVRCRSLSVTFLLASLSFIIAGGVVYGQGNEPSREARALALLEEILGRPEFQWQEPQQSFLQRIWEWIGRQLFNLAPDSLANGHLLTILLAVLGITLLLTLLIYITSRFKRQITSSPERPQVTGDRDLQDSAQAMVRAQSVAEEGDYRLALRYLYLSTLLLLHERGVVNYDRTRTNLEYLQSVAHQPRLAATLREIIETFDRSWYGLQTPDAQTYAQFESHVRNLRDLR